MSQQPVAFPCLRNGPEKGFDGSFPDNGSDVPAVDDLGRFGTVSSTIWLDPMRAVRENDVHVDYSHDTFTASRTEV